MKREFNLSVISSEALPWKMAMYICPIDKKSKKFEYVCNCLLFIKLEPATGSRGGLGGACLGGARVAVPPFTTHLLLQ